MTGENQKNADLKTLIDSLHLTASEFSREINVPKSNLSEMMNNKRALSKGVMLKIKARYPQVNMSWMVTGEGEMFSKKEPAMTQESAALLDCRRERQELENEVNRLKAELYDLYKQQLHD
jgi:plasmid maintenance system antidote protein VapI